MDRGQIDPSVVEVHLDYSRVVDVHMSFLEGRREHPLNPSCAHRQLSIQAGRQRGCINA
jgi:hypothetical protein